jgi:hypothetical protein
MNTNPNGPTMQLDENEIKALAQHVDGDLRSLGIELQQGGLAALAKARAVVANASHFEQRIARHKAEAPKRAEAEAIADELAKKRQPKPEEEAAE